MKADVGVFKEPSEGSVAVRSRISDDDGAQVGEFLLPGGQNLTEAEALARSIIDLAKTGYDVRKLMPDSM